ncbi:MAG: PepSY domain-containing protein [Steroidobacteraceae bacterium]
MTKLHRAILAGTLISLAAACAEPEDPEPSRGTRVETSGKLDTALEAVPEEVVSAALAARPDLTISEAEYELRDGREYYDVGGTLPDGSELELDMTRVDGAWTVVEFQRDIGADALPADVGAALAANYPGWTADRIIESDQDNGIVIYEFFGADDAAGEPVKVEIKWEQGVAEVLEHEWAH